MTNSGHRVDGGVHFTQSQDLVKGGGGGSVGLLVGEGEWSGENVFGNVSRLRNKSFLASQWWLQHPQPSPGSASGVPSGVLL